MITHYLEGCLVTFCIYLIIFLKDGTTPKSDLASWIYLLIASIIWPLALPLSCWELIRKALSK